MARQPDALSAELTSFVGRRQELATVRRLLTMSRLVTVTGIGGVGKTRLAMRLAAEARRAFPDGIYSIELASVHNPSLVAHSLIDALGIRERSARPPMTVLCDHLEGLHSLLVLDNCEHLVDEVADVADQLLKAAPGVRILATSTRPLGVSGEHVFPLGPLPTPSPGDRLPPGTAEDYPSVALFAERSAAVVPDFELTPANEAAVASLCHRLDGIPLAIELAAVRLRVLSIDGLTDRLDDRFQLLRGGSRNVPQRHRTLEAVIDWSYDLCTVEEQVLWSRAAIFTGGFTIDALETVCSDELLPATAVLDTLAGLIDKSIVVREEVGRQVRFRMLETLRAYGRGKLGASGQEQVLRQRHRDWCRDLLKRASEDWVGPRQQEWASTLGAELPNLRQAFEWCLSEPGEARAGQLMAGAPWFWLALGHLGEGRHWLDKALALDLAATHERSWALVTAAYIAESQGDAGVVMALLDEARQIATGLADPGIQAFAAHVHGVHHLLAGDLSDAASSLAHAIDGYGVADVPPQYADLAVIELATVHIMLSELGEAAGLFDDLYRRSDAVGERWHLSYALWGRGYVALLRDDAVRAEEHLCEAIRIKRSFHDTLGLALAFDVLAATAAVRQEPARAATLFGIASAMWQTVGSRLTLSTLSHDPLARFEATARSALPPGDFDAAFQRGSTLTLAESIAFGLRETTPMPEVTARPDSVLTRREWEVAVLIGEGMTNKDIAAKLVISVRTAEAHVEHIRNKLDFTARTQIANWVAHQAPPT